MARKSMVTRSITFTKVSCVIANTNDMSLKEETITLLGKVKTYKQAVKKIQTIGLKLNDGERIIDMKIETPYITRKYKMPEEDFVKLAKLESEE